MKFKNIPEHMGRSATDLAKDFGISKQGLGQYLNDQRGKKSAFVSKFISFCNLNAETVIFPDRFDHPDGENENCAAYWANVLLEVMQEATKRGFPQQDADNIAKIIRQAIVPMLDEDYYESEIED